jgi:hypothetical protein
MVKVASLSNPYRPTARPMSLARVAGPPLNESSLVRGHHIFARVTSDRNPSLRALMEYLAHRKLIHI